MSRIEKIIKSFLQNHLETGKSVLLALSGGVDSMALFHLLLEEKVAFHVAHVNHNWREESTFECEEIEKLCKQHHIPFHTMALNPKSMVGNLEDLCRKSRLEFFSKIVKEYSLQGVFLAHHADDQAETVLKRVFESASLATIKGLSKVGDYEGLTLFRPLLPIRKSEIQDWVAKKEISFFEDRSNLDLKYLRPRMRSQLFPEISKIFGKEIVPSLFRLSESAHELDEFLEHFLSSYRKKIIKEASSIELDFSDLAVTTTFEWKAILRDFFKREKMTPSNNTLEQMIFHLKRGWKKKIVICVDDIKVVIFKKSITIMQKCENKMVK